MSATTDHHLLILSDSLGPGGAERQLTLLATHMPPDWKVTVFSLADGYFGGILRDGGIDLVVAPRAFRFDPRPLMKVGAFVRESRPDIVHSWGHMVCMAADPVCRAMGIPHIAGVIRRGSVHTLRARWPQLASRFGDVALANSSAGLKAFGVPERRGRVLPNGIAPERLERPLPAKRPTDPFRIVMAATMDARKDYATLIAAVRMLHQDGACPVQATALGDGPLLDQYRDAASDLVAAGIMEFPGRVPEVMDHYDRAHAGILVSAPGWGEGISNSIMEYMTAGLPVVATEAGGNPELVIEGTTGFLVPPRDVTALADRLRRLRDDRGLAARMGMAGRRRIEEEYSCEAMVNKAVAIYGEVMAMKRSS